MMKIIPVAVAVWIFAGSAGHVSAELILNGGFESPTVTVGSYRDFAGGSNQLTDWSVLGNDVLILQTTYGEPGNDITAFNAHSGSNALDITGIGNTGSSDGVEQSLSLQAGTSYTLSFWVGRASGNSNYATAATIGLSIAGGAQVDYTNSNSTAGMVNWEQFTTTFVATGTTTIAFYNATPSGTAYAGLDDVSLNPSAVPEPSSLVATGSALLIVGGWLRFRRR